MGHSDNEKTVESNIAIKIFDCGLLVWPLPVVDNVDFEAV